MAALNFDASQVAPDAGIGELLPKGWYNASIDESDIKPTKDSATTGNAMLTLRFTVLGGKSNGRKLFSRFNIRNTNPVAQEIAYKQLSSVAHACGVLMVQDSQQLHGIPIKVHVKVRAGGPKDVSQPNGEKYDDSNEITMYRNANEQVALADDTPGVAPAGAPGGFGAPAGGFAMPTGFPAPAAQAAQAVPAFAAPGFAAPAGFAPPGFAAPAAATPPAFAQPAASAPPAFAPPAVVQAPAFPPEGWQVHPESPTHFWKGSEVKTEVELRAMMAPAPAAPAAPAFAAPAPVAAAAPTPAVADAAAQAQTQVPPWARQA